MSFNPFNNHDGGDAPGADSGMNLLAQGFSGAAPLGGTPTTISDQALRDILKLRPTIVMIEDNTREPKFDINRPLFLGDIVYDPNNANQWYSVVLPWVATLTFVLSSTTDVFFFTNMLSSPALPDISRHILKVVFPKFYQFSGVQHNRHATPYFVLASQLPFLEQLSFTMHLAGITASRWNKEEEAMLEWKDMHKAGERDYKTFQDIAQHYQLKGIFDCKSLKKVCLEYQHSEMLAPYVPQLGQGQELYEILQKAHEFIVEGFNGRNQHVEVELKRVD